MNDILFGAKIESGLGQIYFNVGENQKAHVYLDRAVKNGLSQNSRVMREYNTY